MDDARRSSRSLRLLVGVVAGLATAALATWASVNTLGAASTDEAAIWLPPTPRGDLALAEQRFASRQQLSAQDIATIQRLAERIPLANEPFDWLGYAALLAGDTAKAEALLAEAKARRPRSRLARMALMQIHATRGDLDPLAAELVPLLRLEPELVGPLTDQWIKSARTERDIAVLARLLRADPAIFARVAESAARAKSSPALLTAFLANNPVSHSQEAARLDRLLLIALVDQGALADARQAWEARSRGKSAPAGQIFSPDFTDRTAPPPFNWDLDGGRDGVVEHRREGGVFVDYFGRGASPFLRQLVTLPPGTHRLDVRQQGEAGSGSGLAWTLRCAGPGKRKILDKPVPANAKSFQVSVAVPGNCPAQWLALESQRALRTGEGQRLVVTRVVFNPAGAP